MAKFGMPASIRRSLENQVKSHPKFKQAVNVVAKETFDSAKRDFLREFDEHPITKEIEGGATASNSSGTLNGYGNLFSFIGFDSSQDPIGQLRSMLKSMMRVSRAKVRRGSTTQVFFDISIPDMKVISSVTPMPWESGRSWVRGIERGISGFGYYMSTESRRFSRSGSAIQTDSRLRSGAYVPRKYMSQILRNLNKNLRRLVR